MIKLCDCLEEKPPIKIIVRLTTFFLLIYIIGTLTGMFFGEPIHKLDLGQNKNVLDIFLNNIRVCISIILIGSVTCGTYSIAILFANGFVLGKLLRYLIVNNMLFIITEGLLPHAIIEIIALCLFSAISVLPFMMIYYFIKTSKYIPANVLCFIGILLSSAVVILFIASILECYVSNLPL